MLFTSFKPICLVAISCRSSFNGPVSTWSFASCFYHRIPSRKLISIQMHLRPQTRGHGRLLLFQDKCLFLNWWRQRSTKPWLVYHQRNKSGCVTTGGSELHLGPSWCRFHYAMDECVPSRWIRMLLQQQQLSSPLEGNVEQSLTPPIAATWQNEQLQNVIGPLDKRYFPSLFKCWARPVSKCLLWDFFHHMDETFLRAAKVKQQFKDLICRPHQTETKSENVIWSRLIEFSSPTPISPPFPHCDG